jgi:2-haloacid dehalogenase
MPLSRRTFLSLAASGVATRAFAAPRGRASETPKGVLGLKAVAFDAFAVFSPALLASRTEALFPGQGATLVEEWRLRQFEYAWLRLLSRHYADFWQVTQDALVFAARKLRLELDAAQRDALMTALLELGPWPDVAPALGALTRSGLRLAFLSNFTAHMLEANIRGAALGVPFDGVFSTDQAKTYKPDPLAYALGTEGLGLRREEILFVAHAGWDAAGAKAFGYPTFWVNRANLPAEELGTFADGVGRDLSDLVRFVGRPESGAGR